jgi:hypothetical protein
VLNTRHARFVAVALVALLSLFGLAACGGGGEDPDKVLKDTFSGAKKVASGKLDLTLTLKAEGAPNLRGPVTVKLTGPFQSQGDKKLPKFDFDLALSASGQTFRAGAVSTGSSGFLKFQGQAYSVPERIFAQFKQGYERSQAQREGTKENQSFASLGVNPENWLKDPENEGEEDVGGVKTTHIASGVDLPKLLDDVNRILSRARGQLGAQGQQLPDQLTPQQRKAVQDAIEDVSFDVYTGKDDKTLRRMTIKVKFEIPEAQRQRAQGLSGGELTFDLVIDDLNKAQTVNPPASPRPFDELAQAARGALGGLGGLGGGGASGGGTATTPPAAGGGDEKAQRYLQCLNEAGGDVAKAQKCADLLNGG